MIHNFEADTADAAWLCAANSFSSTGLPRRQPGRTGPTYELLRACFTVRRPRERWVLSRRPPLNPAFAVAEVVWIVRGRNDARLLNHWNPELPKFAGTADTYHGAYGYRLRHHLGLDQLERAFDALLHNPDTRQIVLQIWDSAIDLPKQDGHPADPDIPCNVLALLKVRDGRLEWTQIMRSNDLLLGFPYNVVQFTTLQEVLAGWLDLEPGAYVHWSDSLHVYADKLDDVRSAQPVNVEPNQDSLCLPKRESDQVFAELERRLYLLANSEVSATEHRELVASLNAPDAYRNLLRVAAADDARRRGWWEAADAVMAECSNPVLTQAWERWAARFRFRDERNKT